MLYNKYWNNNGTDEINATSTATFVIWPGRSAASVSGQVGSIKWYLET